MIDDQILVVMKASGHTYEDAILFLNQLNKLGWTVKPITSFYEGLTKEQKEKI